MNNQVIHIINLDISQPIDPYATTENIEKIKRLREERVLSIASQSKQQGFAVRFWEGVTGSKQSFTNVNLAFKQIVRYAKENNLPHVTIGEDDLQFTAIGAWQYYLKNFPEEFDIYSGGIYAGQLSGNRIVNGYSGHTLITVHKNFYDFFLSANEGDHLDRFFGNYAFEKKFIVCIPFVVKQNPGYSENHKTFISTYEAYEESWIYFT